MTGKATFLKKIAHEIWATKLKVADPWTLFGGGNCRHVATSAV